MSRALKLRRPPIPKANLRAWYRPEGLQGVANNGAVSLWLDSSGNGVHQQQNVPGSMPTYIANAWNGRPSVRFNGSTQALSGGVILSGTSPRTVFLAAAPSGGVNTAAVLTFASLSLSAVAGTGHEFEISTEYAVRISGGARGWSPVGGGDAPTGAINVLAVQSPASATAAGLLGWSNGTSVPAAFTTGPTTAINTDATGSSLGWWRASGIYYPGDLSELIYYDRVLSANEFQDISQYLRNRWGTA